MRFNKNVKIKILLIVFSLLSTKLIFAVDAIVLNTTGGPPLNDPDLNGFMDRVTAVALKRLNYKLVTVNLPAERALINANLGIIDGEISRIAGLDEIYQNLVQVREKIMDWEFVAFSRISSKNINLNDHWQSLNPYSVAIINGWKILEKNIPSNVNLIKVKNPEQLFGMLKSNRSDLIIYEKWSGNHYLKSNQISDIKLITPPLIIKELFIYLHEKHRKLALKLAKTIKDMKSDGAYKKIMLETLK